MKLLSLKITNIASIEEAELHFDRGVLADEPIFLICGPTGAGKTTILNAICLALYNKVPSLLSSGTSDDDREGIPNNHPSQLLRRGTGRGEIELIFEGNDCCPYRAVWEARRSRNKSSGAMQPVSRRLDNISDGSSLTRIREIDEEIKRIVGLTYEQFTRTTLLAQGQFAAFIKAKESEKAEILEKLTGTELYTRIGCSVSRSAREAAVAVETLKAQIAGTPILADEERNGLVERIAALADSITEKVARISVLDGRVQWLRRENTLNASLASNKLVLEKVLAEASAAEAVEAESKIELWDATVDIRRLQAEKRQAENVVEDIKKQLRALGNREAVAAAEEAASKAVEVQKTKVAEAEDVAKKYDITALTEAFRAASDEHTRLARAEVAVMNWQRASSDFVRTQKALGDNSQQLCSAKADLAAKKTRRPDLEKQVGEWSAIRRARMDLNSHIAQLRSRFAETGECPLCGTKDVELHEDAVLDAALEAVEAAYDESHKNLETLDNEISALSTKIKVLTRTEVDLRAELSLRDASVQQAVSELVKFKVDPSEENVLDRILREKEIAEMESASVAKTLAQAKVAIDAFAEAQGVLAKFQAEKEKAMLAHRKLALLSGKLENAEFVLAAKDKEIALWFEASDLERVQIDAVAGMSAEDIDVLRKRRKALADRIRQAEGAVKAVEEQVEDHKRTRPEIDVDVTADSLAAEKKAIEEAKDSEMAERVAAETRIVDDRRNADLIASRRQRLVELSRIRDNWAILDKCFGGVDGKRFRNIAQSYVLRVLLHKSNHYMAHLLPRYRLDCDESSLTINVVDSYRNDTVRAVGLLSGGESFIVSLALALGLSSIAKDKIKADILFIDEGFGSLDRDTLDIVLETLDSLYRIGGRRIGLISHVESMIERIPARIEVNPTSPSASSVEVVYR